MQTDILNLERTIARLRKEVFRWLEYKDIGSKERAKQIELLEKELHDMKQSYDEMSGVVYYFRNCLLCINEQTTYHHFVFFS